MTASLPRYADTEKHMRTHMVITEELPYTGANGSYLSYWVFKPYADNEERGSVHQYLIGFDKTYPTSQTAIIEEAHKNLSREDALKLLLKAEDSDLANNRERVDVTVEPYAGIALIMHYASIPYAPLHDERNKITDSIIQKAVFPPTSDQLKIRKVKPRI